jgi:hypothetical protein
MCCGIQGDAAFLRADLTNRSLVWTEKSAAPPIETNPVEPLHYRAFSALDGCRRQTLSQDPMKGSSSENTTTTSR